MQGSAYPGTHSMAQFQDCLKKLGNLSFFCNAKNCIREHEQGQCEAGFKVQLIHMWTWEYFFKLLLFFLIICINGKGNILRKTDSSGKKQELPIIFLVPVPSCFAAYYL